MYNFPIHSEKLTSHVQLVTLYKDILALNWIDGRILIIQINDCRTYAEKDTHLVDYSERITLARRAEGSCMVLY